MFLIVFINNTGDIFDRTREIAYTFHRKLAYEEKKCEQVRFLYI